MIAPYERKDTQQIRRSPWVAIVDAALPVVLIFWLVVDRITAAMPSLVVCNGLPPLVIGASGPRVR
jgi:hypothetical protein